MKRHMILWTAIVLLAAAWGRSELKSNILRTRWNNMYTNLAIEYKNELYNGVILMSNGQGVTDPAQARPTMASTQEYAQRIYETGTTMDRMTGNGGALRAVGWEMQRITYSMWKTQSHGSPINDEDRQYLSNESLTHLQDIYAVYAKHFTERVIYGQDVHQQQQALLDAHMELRMTGLARILEHDELSLSEQFDLQ